MKSPYECLHNNSYCQEVGMAACVDVSVPLVSLPGGTTITRENIDELKTYLQARFQKGGLALFVIESAELLLDGQQLLIRYAANCQLQLEGERKGASEKFIAACSQLVKVSGSDVSAGRHIQQMPVDPNAKQMMIFRCECLLPSSAASPRVQCAYQDAFVSSKAGGRLHWTKIVRNSVPHQSNCQFAQALAARINQEVSKCIKKIADASAAPNPAVTDPGTNINIAAENLDRDDEETAGDEAFNHLLDEVNDWFYDENGSRDSNSVDNGSVRLITTNVMVVYDVSLSIVHCQTRLCAFVENIGYSPADVVFILKDQFGCRIILNDVSCSMIYACQCTDVRAGDTLLLRQRNCPIGARLHLSSLVSDLRGYCSMMKALDDDYKAVRMVRQDPNAYYRVVLWSVLESCLGIVNIEDRNDTFRLLLLQFRDVAANLGSSTCTRLLEVLFKSAGVIRFP
jgi:hypothetical protein